MNARRIFLVAGEASGDALGAGLMAGIRARAPEVAFSGVGGAGMRREGLESLFPMADLSVMGITEVLARYPALRRRLDETVAAALAAEPDALVTIDSPDFGLRVARRVRAAAPSIRTVHYVAPSVWAWRPRRAAAMAAYVDQVLALLPFEPPYMEAAGMRCDFVGHPAAHVARPERGVGPAFRAAHGIAAEAPVLVVLPGSRRSEIRRLVPAFGRVLSSLSARTPGLRAVVPAAPGLAEELRGVVGGWPGDPVVLDTEAVGDGEKYRAFAAADAALAASGTVSLELAATGTPMVVAYDMAWLSWQIMSRMARVESVTLVNLVSGTRSVPEFLGPDCRPEPIAGALAPLLADPGAGAEQRAAMAETMHLLGRDGPVPGALAAEAVLAGLSPVG